VTVRYRAGYAAQDGRSTVPAPIRHAVLLMVGHLYSNRDAVTTTAAQPAQLPLGVEALVAPYRIWG
ncbi:head-tail connector protein, partial [Acinetobacter baumannii]